MPTLQEITRAQMERDGTLHEGSWTACDGQHDEPCADPHCKARRARRRPAGGLPEVTPPPMPPIAAPKREAKRPPKSGNKPEENISVRVLLDLLNHPTSSRTDIATRLGLDANRVSSALFSLVEQLKVERSGERWFYRFTLTAAGKQAARQLAEVAAVILEATTDQAKQDGKPVVHPAAPAASAASTAAPVEQLSAPAVDGIRGDPASATNTGSRGGPVRDRSAPPADSRAVTRHFFLARDALRAYLELQRLRNHALDELLSHYYAARHEAGITEPGL
jgi:hypothetical protein